MQHQPIDFHPDSTDASVFVLPRLAVTALANLGYATTICSEGDSTIHVYCIPNVWPNTAVIHCEAGREFVCPVDVSIWHCNISQDGQVVYCRVHRLIESGYSLLSRTCKIKCALKGRFYSLARNTARDQYAGSSVLSQTRLPDKAAFVLQVFAAELNPNVQKWFQSNLHVRNSDGRCRRYKWFGRKLKKVPLQFLYFWKARPAPNSSFLMHDVREGLHRSILKTIGTSCDTTALDSGSGPQIHTIQRLCATLAWTGSEAWLIKNFNPARRSQTERHRSEGVFVEGMLGLRLEPTSTLRSVSQSQGEEAVAWME